MSLEKGDVEKGVSEDRKSYRGDAITMVVEKDRNRLEIAQFTSLMRQERLTFSQVKPGTKESPDVGADAIDRRGHPFVQLVSALVQFVQEQGMPDKGG